MTALSTTPVRVRRFALASIAGAALALSACGGGGGGGDAEPPPPGTSPGDVLPLPAPAIEALAGNWVQKGCVKVGFQSFKRLLRARLTSPTTIDYDEGVLTFNGDECAGAPQQAGPTRLGVVTFAKSEANQSLAAWWGVFQTVTGTRFGAIWTVRSGNQLCLLGDDMPSSQPSLSAVATSLATVPADNCFTR